MTPDGSQHPHPPITGEPGELVELFMQLVDRETELDAHWWYNYGSLTLLNFTAGFFPRDMDRTTAMGALREVLDEAVAHGRVAENFLIKALKRELDDFVRGKEDPANYNARVDRMRNTMQDVIDDPHARARWRRAMASVDVAYATKTDEELIADARKTLTNSVTTKHLSPDDVAGRWADAEQWWMIADQLLPETIFERWAHLNSQREIDQQRQQTNLGD
jgi:hypothetical protein